MLSVAGVQKKERNHCHQSEDKEDVLLAARWGGGGIVGDDVMAPAAERPPRMSESFDAPNLQRFNERLDNKQNNRLLFVTASMCI
jgi:hypothetical protein